jgi:hypothetical protein
MAINNQRAILDFSVRADLPGAVVRIEQSDTLAEGSWNPLDSPITGLSGGYQHRAVEIPASGKLQSFYRMVVIEPPR